MPESMSLVTGASGHLGYNLVKELIGRGERVRAGVRSPEKQARLKGLDCEVVPLDIQDRTSLDASMKGVEVVYAVGAAFIMWSADPENDIYRVNREGTRHLIESAAAHGVRKVVYVSSMTALDPARQPADELSWNPSREIAYEGSKTEAEQLALSLGAKLGLDVSTILPGAIYGPDFIEPSPTTGMFVALLHKLFPADPGMFFLYVDVRDLAAACYLAAKKGRAGERYLVANEQPVSTTGMIAQARTLYPQLAEFNPPLVDRDTLLAHARADVERSRREGTPVSLYPRHVEIYCGASALRANTSKAQRELGVRYRSAEVTIRDSLAYAASHFVQQS